MNAVRWEGAWRFSIFLAFLLLFHVRHSNALNINIDGPYTPYRSSDDRYDFVDVAKQQSAARQQSETGQTSQFYTAGDVDEAFWLKELGDDFKNAIHMQVGGEEPHNGVFNMSENGAAYKVQRIIQPNARTVTQNEIQKPNEKPGKQRKRNRAENSEGKKRQRKLKHEKISERSEKSIEKKSNAATSAENLEMQAENNSTQTTANAKDMHENAHEDLKFRKFQHIQIQYAPEKKSRDHEKSQTVQQNQTLTDKTIEESPVVVNLPETGDVVELKANDAPVVVKMPPVIYHSKPANVTEQDRDENADNKQTEEQKETTETHSEQADDKDEQHISNIDNTQYKKQTYTSTTYEQQQQQEQQYDQQHTQYTEEQQYSQPIEYKNDEQQTQHTQYPVQIQQTQYQESQTLPFNQHEQKHQYSPATSIYHSSISSPYHHNHGVYPSADINSAPTYPSLPSTDVLDPTNMARLRYMISKPSIPIAAYGEYDAPQTQMAYNRDRRSTRKLYQQGL